jgi:hypothetical protein
VEEVVFVEVMLVVVVVEVFVLLVVELVVVVLVVVLVFEVENVVVDVDVVVVFSGIGGLTWLTSSSQCAKVQVDDPAKYWPGFHTTVNEPAEYDVASIMVGVCAGTGSPNEQDRGPPNGVQSRLQQ